MFNLPAGFQPTDEYAKSKLGMSLADYYSKNPGAQQAAGVLQTQENIAQDPLYLAKQAQAFQVQQNQPAIQTLQSQYNPSTGGGSLVDKYNALIDSITSAEQPAVDVATKGVNAELAARGIVSSNQGVGNQELQNTLNPLTTQFGQLKSQTGLSEQQDLAGIAGQIAGLQAGNVGNSLNFASGIAGQQENLAATLASVYGPQQVSPNNILVNPSNGQTIASNIPQNILANGNTSSGSSNTSSTKTTLNNNPVVTSPSNNSISSVPYNPILASIMNLNNNNTANSSASLR